MLYVLVWYNLKMKPLSKINFTWSPKLAYVIGLIATDGNLSPDGRHINFTTKDIELAKIFKSFLKFRGKIGTKARGGEKDKKYYVVQPGDVIFYRFLQSIGLCPKKSKTISKLQIHKDYFYDFLRGCLDGDGNVGFFKHPQSRLPQFRTRLFSASEPFLNWVQNETKRRGIKGFLTKTRSVYVLAYAKRDSTKLLNLVYYDGFPSSLTRKYKVARQIMEINKK